MQTTEIRFVVLFLFLFSNAEGTFRECGEFDHSDVVAREIDEDLEVLPFQDELEQLFDAFDKNDDEHMEAAYKLLENIKVDEVDRYGADLIKYVVRTKNIK